MRVREKKGGEAAVVAAADDSAVFGRRGEVLAMARGRMMQAGSNASSAAAAEGDAVVGGVQPFGLTRFAFALGSCTVWELKIVLHVLHLKKREEKGLSFQFWVSVGTQPLIFIWKVVLETWTQNSSQMWKNFVIS